MATEDVTAPGLVSLEALYCEQGKLARALLAPLTRQGYEYDWRTWERWCRARGLTPLPADPEAVALFVVDLLRRQKKTSTVRRLLAGIAHVHRRDKLPIEWSERVEDLIAGSKRLRPEALEQVTPLTTDDIREMSIALAADGSARAIRNRAILVAGFASALRSASPVALEVADVEFESRGAILRIRREKNDQAGKGRLIGLPHGRHIETCPVRSLQAWLALRGTAAGALFSHVPPPKALGAERICLIVQQSLKLIGRCSLGYGSHSLRSGLVTAAGEAHAGELSIAAHTGHRDLDMVRRYFRKRDVFRANVCDLIGL